MIYQAEGARIIGEVSFGEDCSIWYNAVIRGDSGSISFGNRVNIQDGKTLVIKYNILRNAIQDACGVDLQEIGNAKAANRI